MSRHCIDVLLIALCVCHASGAAESSWHSPRTEHGQPDLQGLWDFGTKTPFQRPAALGERRSHTEQEVIELQRKARAANAALDAPVDLSKNAPTVGDRIGQESDNDAMERREDFARVNGEYRTSIVVDPPNGQVPKRAGFNDYLARQKAQGIASADAPETLDASSRCFMPLPVPSIYPMPWSALLQIVQSRDHVVLHTEMIHDARIVRLNGKHRGGGAKLWLGDSVGRFEGDTLVVHTINFRPEQSYAAILPMSDEFELTERFTRTARDEILYRFTVVDAKAYTQSFTGERTFKRAAPGDRILEFACHEGNYAMTGILAGARKLEESESGRRP